LALQNPKSKHIREIAHLGLIRLASRIPDIELIIKPMVDDLIVTLNEQVISPNEWRNSIQQMPGDITITVRSPNWQTFRKRISLKEHEHRQVIIHLIPMNGVALGVRSGLDEQKTATSSLEMLNTNRSAPLPAQPIREPRVNLTPVWVGVSATAMLGGTSALFMIEYSRINSMACVGCNVQVREQNARLYSGIALGTGIGALLSAGISTYLYFSLTDSSKPNQSALQISPSRIQFQTHFLLF
jgi:hypothetical protein